MVSAYHEFPEEGCILRYFLLAVAVSYCHRNDRVRRALFSESGMLWSLSKFSLLKNSRPSSTRRSTRANCSSRRSAHLQCSANDRVEPGFSAYSSNCSNGLNMPLMSASLISTAKIPKPSSCSTCSKRDASARFSRRVLRTALSSLFVANSRNAVSNSAGQAFRKLVNAR